MVSSTLQKFFSEPENAAIYSKWISDPATKQFLAFAEEVSYPLGLTNPTGEAGLYYHGQHTGFYKILSFLKNMELFAAISAENMEPVATFGGNEILNDWGIPKK